MEMTHTSIPKDELEMFSGLTDIKVVFDVGARADVEYLRLKEGITLHAFEPNPDFFAELKQNAGDTPNVFLNNYGLGDVESQLVYNNHRQCFVGSEEVSVWNGERVLPVKTLDWYVAENKIEQIDFLKIDTEGFDYRVLLGGLETIPKCRYIQYEHWNLTQHFHDLLEPRFIMEYIGNRNVLCTRK